MPGTAPASLPRVCPYPVTKTPAPVCFSNVENLAAGPRSIEHQNPNGECRAFVWATNAVSKEAGTLGGTHHHVHPWVWG